MDIINDVLNKKLFTDLELILKDSNNIIKLDVHKIVLLLNSLYFQKLLTTFNECNLNSITIEVPNAYISYDIIMSFYKIKTNSGFYDHWRYILEAIKCYDFFHLDYDYSKLLSIDIPEEGFQLLLNTIPYLEDNVETFDFIRKSIPKNYDINLLSDDLINKLIITKDIPYFMAMANEDIITIINPNKLNNTILKCEDKITHLCLTMDNKYILSALDNNNVYLWNIDKCESILICKSVYEIKKITISSDNKYVLISHSSQSVSIFNFNNGNPIFYDKIYGYFIDDFYFSHNNSKILLSIQKIYTFMILTRAILKIK